MAVGTLSNVKVDPVAGSLSAKYVVDATLTATSVFCGFTPRTVRLTQIAGTLTTAVQSLCFESMATGTSGNLTYLVHGTGASSIITTSGVTFLSGTEASPAAAATGSPASAGAGFSIGIGMVGITQTYLIEAVR